MYSPILLSFKKLFLAHDTFNNLFKTFSTHSEKNPNFMTLNVSNLKFGKALVFR